MGDADMSSHPKMEHYESDTEEDEQDAPLLQQGREEKSQKPHKGEKGKERRQKHVTSISVREISFRRHCISI